MPILLKKAVYLSSSTVLGIFLSFIAHASIEMGFLKWAQSRGLVVIFYGGCALPPLLQITLFLAGAAGGFFLGRIWWQKIYVEGMRFKKHN